MNNTTTSTGKTKAVAFAPLINVGTIPPGQGTWENGQRAAPCPTAWQINNADRILAKTLEEIEREEREDAELAKKWFKAKADPSEAVHSRPEQSNVVPKRKPVPKSRPAPLQNVTFESFLAEGKVAGDEAVQTPTSFKSFKSATSIKSLSEKFLAKFRMQ